MSRGEKGEEERLEELFEKEGMCMMYITSRSTLRLRGGEGERTSFVSSGSLLRQP